MCGAELHLVGCIMCGAEQLEQPASRAVLNYLSSQHHVQCWTTWAASITCSAELLEQQMSHVMPNSWSRLLSSPGCGGPPSPPHPHCTEKRNHHLEWEVPGPWHTECSRSHIVQVPGEDEEDKGVDDQHGHGMHEGEVVIHTGRLREAGPLGPLACHTVTTTSNVTLSHSHNNINCNIVPQSQQHQM